MGYVLGSQHLVSLSINVHVWWPLIFHISGTSLAIQNGHWIIHNHGQSNFAMPRHYSFHFRFLISEFARSSQLFYSRPSSFQCEKLGGAWRLGYILLPFTCTLYVHTAWHCIHEIMRYKINRNTRHCLSLRYWTASDSALILHFVELVRWTIQVIK